MDFLNAGLLGFSLLAAVPVLIHLLHRPRPRTQPFPSLILLQRCARRSRAMSHIRNLILMLLRAAAVASLAVSLARPRIAGAAQAPQEGIAAAIVLDDAYRMAYRDAGRSRFDDARERALDVLGTLPPATECVLALSSGDVTPLLPDPSPLRAELSRLREGDLAGTLLPALVEASRTLEDAPGRRREIHVFTDMTRAAWSGASPEELKRLAGATLYVHDVGRDSPTNAAVTRIDVAPRSPRAGRPVEISATVAAWGPPGPLSVALQCGDGHREERLVNVPDGGTAITRFQFVPKAGLAMHGSIRILSPDPLAADNERFFAAPVNAMLKLLIVERPEAPPYLAFALSPPSLGARRPVEVTTSSSVRDLDTYDAVLIGDPELVRGEDLNRLVDCVRGGAGLALLAGSPRDVIARFAEAGLAPQVTADQPLPQPMRLSSNTADHPAFAGFRAGRNGDLSAPEFTRRLLAAPDVRWKAVLRFEDGAPAALEAPLGRGRIFFLPFGLVGWTDLPKHPCFVPFLHEVARSLSRTAQSERDAPVGTPVILDLGARVTDPAYAFVDLATGDRESRRAEPGTQVVPLACSMRPGRYAVEVTCENGPQIRPFAVNIDPAGSDPTRLTLDDVRKILPQSNVLQPAARTLAVEVKQNRFGEELTVIALLLVALFLFVELFVASKP